MQVFGSQRYALRLFLNPEAMSKRGLGLERVVSAIQNANSNLPSGVLQGAARDFTVKSSATLQRAENFNNLIVAYNNGMPVRLSDVGQAVVVPVDDEIKGTKPVAFVIPKAGHDPTEDAIKKYALANAPAYQHPRFVWFMDELPLASTNKVDRAALRKLAEERVAGAASPERRSRR